MGSTCVPELGGSPNLPLLLKHHPTYAHLFSLWRWQELQLGEFFLCILKYIDYFSIYQTGMTKVTDRSRHAECKVANEGKSVSVRWGYCIDSKLGQCVQMGRCSGTISADSTARPSGLTRGPCHPSGAAGPEASAVQGCVWNLNQELGWRLRQGTNSQMS